MTSPVLLVITASADCAREAIASVEGAGCRVRHRETVLDAVADLATLPDIALLALDSELSANGAVAHIRASAAGVDTPLLLLYPADAPDEALTAGMEDGADACITRPLRCATIRAWVHMAERLQMLALTRRGKAKVRLDRVTEPLLRSASLAHAVSGPLQNLSAAIDLMELALPPDFNEQEQLTAMRRHLHRTAEIVRGASEEARLALRRVNGND